MRRTKKKTKSVKGQMRVVEAILSSFVILLAVTFLNVFAVTPMSPMYETSELEKMGYNVLHDLDEQRLLCRFVFNSEWQNLTAALMASLPPDVYFDLIIYHINGTVVNQNVPIRYGDAQVFESSTSIASVSYIIPGYQTNYAPKVLTLQLVRG